MKPDWWMYAVDIAQILSAVGTSGAVIVSLWLALRRPKPLVEGWSGIRAIVGAGVTEVDGKFPEYLTFQVTNVGSIDCVITGFSWRTGYLKHHWAYQKMGYSDSFVQSASVPANLTHGQSASYFVPAFGGRSWFARMADQDDPFTQWHSTRTQLESLRLFVSTSVGVSYKIKPEKPVLDRIWENISKARQGTPESGNAKESVT